MHIYQLLKEREKIREDEKKWVLREALSAKKLQSGGTFRNVIARKLDEVIIPIFAEIIALIDHNYNLDLVDPKSHNTPVAQFWLAMFRDPKVMQFSFAEMSVREQVPGVGGRMAEEEFRCQLPFSWLVREAFEAQWDSAKSVAGNCAWYTDNCAWYTDNCAWYTGNCVWYTGNCAWYTGTIVMKISIVWSAYVHLLLPRKQDSCPVHTALYPCL